MGGIVGVNRGQRKKGKEYKREIDKYSEKEGRNRREGRKEGGEKSARIEGEGRVKREGEREGRRPTTSLL